MEEFNRRVTRSLPQSYAEFTAEFTAELRRVVMLFSEIIRQSFYSVF